ncbi:MAG: restriction endonuclease subunit S [Amaricoccus sp.]|uniref:restriction endonuclease subunit S n=1 Tax=Amaricoccus sp. TaxID=1872485 RepID=UPI003315E04A
MSHMQLRHFANVFNSNVDKIVDPNEEPVRLCNYVDVYKNDFISLGLDFQVGSATPREIERFGLRMNDVIITKDSEDRHDIGVPALVRETAPDLVCGYHLTVLRADTSRCHGGFLFWALQSKRAREAFSIAASGVTRYGLTQDGIRSQSIWLPDLEAQQRIAAFLDAEMARIDALIEKKRRMLLVFDERLQAIADQATSPTDADVTVPLRRVLLKIEQGWSPECEARLAEDGEWGVLKVGCVNGWSFAAAEHKALPAALAPRRELEVRDGDVLMSRANTRELVGSVAVVEGAPRRLMLCDLLYRLTFDERKISTQFAVLALRSRRARQHYEVCSNGSSASMQKIRHETIRSLMISLPPINRQRHLVAAFEETANLLSTSSTKVRRSIDRLREYRSALITEAVTGQLDIDAWRRRGSGDAHLDRIAAEAGE